MSKKRVLLVEDDSVFCIAVNRTIGDLATVKVAQNARQAFVHIKESFFDVAIVDLNLNGPLEGLEILKEIKSTRPRTHCIILSGQDEEEIVIKAYEMGCDQFFVKRQFQRILKSYLQRLLGNDSETCAKLTEIFKSFQTKDPELVEDLKKLCSMSFSQQTLFLSGPSGSGKTLLAKALHRISTFSEGPFIHVNCAEISPSLFESEFFGHVKGAFTGASANKPGKVLQANGGTLFLDEIATLPMEMQQKLLKVLDEKRFSPVGSNEVVTTQFFLISATWENLEHNIELGNFRHDLWFRISGLNFELPPLSQRPLDIPFLLKELLCQGPQRVHLAPDMWKFLQRYSWPGNIRELSKFAQYLLSYNKGKISLNEGMAFFKNIKSANAMLPEMIPELTETQQNYISSQGLRHFIRLTEKDAVEKKLKENGGKVLACAKDLKISSSAFYRILNS